MFRKRKQEEEKLFEEETSEQDTQPEVKTEKSQKFKLDKTTLYVGGAVMGGLLVLWLLTGRGDKVVVQGDIQAQKKILEETLKSQAELNQKILQELNTLNQRLSAIENTKDTEKKESETETKKEDKKEDLKIVVPSEAPPVPPPPPSGVGGFAEPPLIKEPYKPKINRIENKTESESRSGTEIQRAQNVVFVEGEPQDRQEKKAEKTKASGKVYLPAGTTLKGVVVNSFPAPVDGSFPAVLIELYGYARTPNNYRVSVDRCLVIAKGQGTYVLERAKLETYKFSCVLKNGQVLETDIKGMVVSGEDGMEGIQGKFINVNREQLLTALGGGTLSGFFSALQRGQLLQKDTVFGATTTIKDEFLYALYGSLASTWDEFAKWYLDQAKKIMPVVVVSGGKPVYITLIDGVSLDVEVDDFRRNT